MNADAGSVIAVAAVIALVVWGLIPRRRSAEDTSAPGSSAPLSPEQDAELARKVGIVTGVMGGSIEDAAVTKYALSRLEKPPTPMDIGVAAGAEASTRTE